MEAVGGGEDPALNDETEAAALRIVSAMLAGDVDDETWEACVPPLDHATVLELIALVGYYSTLALQMKVFRVDLLPASTMAIGGGHGLAAISEGF
jgi:4-carboxymuconolactone decarboxylase